MNLLLLILVPLLTALAVLTMPTKQGIRWAAFIGASIQLALAFGLYAAYRSARLAGDTAAFLFEKKIC